MSEPAEPTHLDDRRLTKAMSALDPSSEQVTRVGRDVMATFAERQRPLAVEWWALFRARPVTHTALALAAALVLLVLSPAAATPGLLLRLLPGAVAGAVEGASAHAAALFQPSVAIAKARPSQRR